MVREYVSDDFRSSHIVASAVAALALLPTSGMAIDTDADDYVASPPGTNLGLLYYQHVQRDYLFSNGNQVPGNAGLDSDTGILRVVHFLKLGDYVVDPQFILPFGSETGTNDASSLGGVTGLADLILAATTWLVNDDKTNTYLGITPFLFLPTGTYDKTKPLNWGENRWKFTLQNTKSALPTSSASCSLETQLFLAITISSVRPLQR